MSNNLGVPMKSGIARTSAADTRILAQVEKWMALIREIKHQPATS